MKHATRLVCLVIFLAGICKAQSISVTGPLGADAAQTLPVTISCSGDKFLDCIISGSFTTCTSNLQRIYLKRDQTILQADSIKLPSNTVAIAYFKFPLAATVGSWDVAAEHTYGTTLLQSSGFAINNLANPVIDSISPVSAPWKKKLTMTINANHAHFKFVQTTSAENNIVKIWLSKGIKEIPADSFKITNSNLCNAFFTIPDSCDTGLYNVNVEQGNGRPTAVLAGKFNIFAVWAVPSIPVVVAHWSFDSFTGSSCRDVTGHGYDAIGTGTGLEQAPGIKGNALGCKGGNFEMLVSKSSDSFILNKFSIEFWYYSAIDPATQIAASNGLFTFNNIQTGVRNGYGLDIKSDGRLCFGMAASNGGSWISAYSTTVLKAQTWYFIVASFDSTFLRVYVNGALEGSTAYSGTFPPPNSNAQIGFQKRMDGSSNYWANGRFDEMKLFNYPLKADSVTAHYKMTDTAYPVPRLIPYTPNPTYNRRPRLQWYSDSSMSTFRIQLSATQTFSSLFISVPTTDTSYMPTVDLPFGTNYWRVCNDADTSRWSKVSSVTVLDTTVPLLIHYSPDPTHNRKPVLLWHRVTGSTAYTVQISSAPGFASPFISDAVSDTVYAVSVNLPLSTIYWRVKSSLNIQYSPPDTFVVLNDSIPLLIPMAPDTQNNRRPSFRWYKAIGASSYRIQIDTIGTFANPFISTPVTDTIYTPLANLPTGRIFWRVSSNTIQDRYSPPDTFQIMTGTSVNSQLLIGITAKMANIQLFTLDGRLLENMTITKERQLTGLFDHKKYRPGVYICRVVYGKSDIQTKKIMIKR